MRTSSAEVSEKRVVTKIFESELRVMIRPQAWLNK